ncbi:MAG: AAA family ATPase [Candidatus Hodarchaeota archaeon]
MRTILPLIIAIVGKGGVGKTVITTLMAKAIIQNYNYKLLLIDADPTHPHLSKMVKSVPQKSLEQVRLEIIEKTLNKEKSIETLAENIDFEVYSAISETKDFSLFSIGQPEGPGCFCPSNALLKKVIESISKDFEIVLIDCEAGLEQINRMVIEKIDILLIVVDVSLRSVETALSIKKSASKFTKYQNLGIIINKARGDISIITNKLSNLELPILAKVPDDELIRQFDLEGKAIIDLSSNSSIFKEIVELIKIILSRSSNI